MKPKRETAEQRARRIGRGLGFYLLRVASDKWEFRAERPRPYIGNAWTANAEEIALWRALERSQRALARARGVRL